MLPGRPFTPYAPEKRGFTPPPTPLDEIGEADGREIGAAIYLLGNAVAKARADRTGAARAVGRFRTLILSNGETTLAAAMAAAGDRTRAGQAIRIVDLNADAGAGHGVLDQLHGAGSASAFLTRLNAAARTSFGTPIRAFLAYVTSCLANEAGFRRSVRDRVMSCQQRFLAAHSRADPQVATVARRFALVAIAGELAGAAGVTCWPDGEALRAAQKTFDQWVQDRGGVGGGEDARATRQLRDFISRHGANRFEDWAARDAGDQDAEGRPPPERFRPPNRAGWKKWEVQASHDGRPATGGWHYLMTPEALREALDGLDVRAVLPALIEAGLILPGSDHKSSTPMRPPGIGKKIRLYRVPSHVVGADDGDGNDDTDS